MKAFRARLSVVSRSDSGLTLVEVIIALLIFGIVAVGVAYSLANSLTISRDARNRVAAANIASEFIDNARSIENVFTIVDQADVPRTVGGTKYHVRVETGWVTSTDTQAQCGAATSTGSGALEFKRIAVYVTWDGMRAGTVPIRSDTILAPNSRINDPTLGTIVISAENALGGGSAGITVNTQPSASPAGAVAVPNQGLNTDSDGCSYVLKVVPGNYDVTLTRSNYVDLAQTVTSTKLNVTVVAGGSALAKVAFDNGALITSRYPASPSATVNMLVPTNLQTTFSSTKSTTVLAGANPARVFPDSYQLVAGTYDATNCKAPDPAAWATRGDGAFGERMDPVSVAAGASATVDLPMGRVLVTVGGLKDKYITAVLQPDVSNGNPGCTSAVDANDAPLTKYTFRQTPDSTPSNTAYIALPYGTYKLYYGSSSGSTSSNLTGTPLNAAGVPIGTPATQTVVIDPRIVH